MENKVLDMRTERGLRVYHNLCDFYPQFYYEFDKEVLFSEGFTHWIDGRGEIHVV